MNSHFRYALFAAYSLLACYAKADSIPSLTATSASVAVGDGCDSSFGCSLAFSAAGPLFTLSGSGFSGSSFRIPGLSFLGSNPSFLAFGAQIPVPAGGGQASGQVTLAGTSYFANYSGSGMANGPSVEISPIGNLSTGDFTVSSGDITAPPITPSSPSTTIILPATLEASFAACIAQPTTQCPSAANISIDLSGELTFGISVFYIGTSPDYADISESFVSTPVPEPASIVLAALGAAFAMAVRIRRRCHKLDVSST